MFKGFLEKSTSTKSMLSAFVVLVAVLGLFLSVSPVSAVTWEGGSENSLSDILGEDAVHSSSFGVAADSDGDYWVITAPGIKTVYFRENYLGVLLQRCQPFPSLQEKVATSL